MIKVSARQAAATEKPPSVWLLMHLSTARAVTRSSRVKIPARAPAIMADPSSVHGQEAAQASPGGQDHQPVTGHEQVAAVR